MPFLARMDHSGTGWVQFSDGHCTFLTEIWKVALQDRKPWGYQLGHADYLTNFCLYFKWHCSSDRQTTWKYARYSDNTWATRPCGRQNTFWPFEYKYSSAFKWSLNLNRQHVCSVSLVFRWLLFFVSECQFLLYFLIKTYTDWKSPLGSQGDDGSFSAA
jgi:hypothetical protein